MKRTAFILFVCIVVCIGYRVTRPAYAVKRAAAIHTAIKTMALVASSDEQMFTVTGGRIEIVSLFGECTTALDGSAGFTVIQFDATTSSDYDRDFTTVINLLSLGTGDVLRYSNAIGKGVPDNTANVGAGQTLSWICDSGEIEFNGAVPVTGTIVWYLSYRKLESGTEIVASE